MFSAIAFEMASGMFSNYKLKAIDNKPQTQTGREKWPSLTFMYDLLCETTENH